MANVNVTYTLSNCTCNITANPLTTGQQYDFIITANDGYKFNSAPTFRNLGGNEIAFTKISDTQYSYSIKFTTSYKNVYITGYAAEIPKIKEYDYSFTIDIKHSTTNILPNTNYHLTENDTLEITVTADEGYYFADYPMLRITFNSGSTGDYTFTPIEAIEYPNAFRIGLKPKDTYSGTFKILANPAVTPKNDKYGIINIYNPTVSEMKSIGEVRYVIIADGNQFIDLGNFITNIIKLFVNIPQGNKATVMLGGYNTHVESNVVIDDIIETDCGNVAINGFYNNSMDYQQTEVEIYLPFIGFQSLETKKVMGETLHLIYRTNVINGDSIACIYNGIGTLLYTFECNVAFEVPYRLNSDYDSRSTLRVDNNYLFGFTPFVTIRRNKPYNSVEYFAADDRYCQVKDLLSQGFIKCNNAQNNIRCTDEERQEIESFLNDGIIV